MNGYTNTSANSHMMFAWLTQEGALDTSTDSGALPATGFLTLDKDQYDYDDLSLQLEYELPYTELKEDKESYYEDNYYGDDS